MARRAGLRLDARLRPRDGDPGAGGDRPAAAPQPRRDVVGGDEPAQAGLALDGDDARDDLAPAVRGEGRGPLRLARQGPGGPGAGARGCRPTLGPVHHRAADRHRREPDRAGGVDLRAAPGRPAVRPRPGSHHPELPGQARHRDAAHRRPRARGVPRRDRRLPDRARPQDAGPGAAQPRRPRGVHGPARRRRRRLGRGLAADPGPRQPRAALALAGAAPLDHRRGRLHPAGQADRSPGVRRGRGALDRPTRLGPRGGPRRRRRPRPRGRPAAGPALARARRRLRRASAAPTSTRPWTPRAGPTTAAPTSTRSTATGTSSRAVVEEGEERARRETTGSGGFETLAGARSNHRAALAEGQRARIPRPAPPCRRPSATRATSATSTRSP